MAIVIEEEKPDKISITTFVGWGVILAVIAATVYYVFFRKPEIISVTIPENLLSTQRVSQIQLNTESVVSHPNFRDRRQYINPPVPGNLGKENPFIPFE